MADIWVCIDCGARQPDEGGCRACKSDTTLDTRDEKVRELMADVDLRLQQKREARFRFIGVGIGVSVVFLLWVVPGFWAARGRYFALPMLLDQWALMAVIGYGVSRLLEKLYAKKRFPYLDTNQEIVG